MGMISLHQELLTATIHKCVLEGLDETVPMCKPSVEWVDQIPAHWTQKRFKYVATVRLWETEPGGKWMAWGRQRVHTESDSWDILGTKKGLKFKTSYEQEDPNSLLLIHLGKDQDLNFWLFYLNSHFAQSWLRREISMTKSLTVQNLQNLPVFEPPRSEQEAISAHLVQVSNRVNQITEKLS